MSQQSQLKYPHRPIATLATLSIALRMPVADLQGLADRAEKLYRNAKPIPKSDGTFRQPVDALEPLKSLHRRIKSSFFAHVVFPDYLTGSIKGRDATRNANLHAGQAIVVCEDIEKFFPSTTIALVNEIWSGFFGFAPEVASLLARLTTKNGRLPEGAITSSYLANLVFWKHESVLQESLKAQGIVYSRYVDDITFSAARRLLASEITGTIAKIYGMLSSLGYRAKRQKHQIMRGHDRMIVTKLVINERTALTADERQAIRAAVFQLECEVDRDGFTAELAVRCNSVAGRVGRLRRLHPSEGAALKTRLRKLRNSEFSQA